MLQKEKGFTLIELLIVVSIIAILTLLLVFHVGTAINKAKQKKSMASIVRIATACVDYVTDNSEAPDQGNQNGPLSAGNSFVTSLVPMYVKNCPLYDEWGNAFLVYSGMAAAGVYGIPGGNVSEDDFVIVSLGSDGDFEGWVFEEDDPGNGLFSLRSREGFRRDLINFSGNWIRAPRVGISNAGS